MKFELWSDFHVEQNKYWNWKNAKSDMLVLAGDTSNSIMKTYNVLKEAASVYRRVLFVPGNHEYYNNHDFLTSGENLSVNFTNTKLRNFADTFDNVSMLDANNEQTYIHCEGKTAFIGDLGWYDWNYPGMSKKHQIDIWASHLNDSQFIVFDELLPADLARQAANILEQTVANLNEIDTIEEIVVVTHTVPHIMGLVGPGHPYEPTNGSYYNSEMHRVWEVDKNKKIKLWCFGHTHFLNDFVEAHVRFVSNPRGYKREQIHRKRTPVVLDTEWAK